MMIRNSYNYLIEKDFRILVLFSLLSIFPLMTVYILEYFFAVEPCKLCIYQRIPLFITAALPLVFIPQSIRKHSFKGFFVALLAILCNVAISFYHFGIENKWFINSICHGFDGKKGTMENFFMSTQTLFQDCTEVKYRILGLSLAGWNFIYCIMFFMLIIFFIGRKFISRL